MNISDLTWATKLGDITLWALFEVWLVYMIATIIIAILGAIIKAATK